MAGIPRRAVPGLRAAIRWALAVMAVMLAQAPGRGDDEGRPAPAEEPTMIREGFETPGTVWRQEQTDATITLLAHDRSTRAAHEGKTSEHFRFTAGLGSGFFFSYPLPKVPVTDALKTSLYVRANRAGVQLFTRVVLPADTDPETNQPSFLLVPGTIYDNVDRWQRLEVVELRLSLESQARVLRASTRRPVSLEGAYIEQLVVNLFSGAGETDVFLDEVSVGPVPATVAQAHADAGDEQAAPDPDHAEPAAGPQNVGRAMLSLNLLKKRGEDGLYRPWFFTAIHAPGADVVSLRNAGFDVLIDDIGADPERLKQAVKMGLQLMPRVYRDGEPLDPKAVYSQAVAFPFRDAVFAWDLGNRLGRHVEPDDRKEELATVQSTVSVLRRMPSGNSGLTAAIVADDHQYYARPPKNVGLLGIEPPAWGGSVNPFDIYKFLNQRHHLTARENPTALFWAMLPATPPPIVRENVWGHDVPPSWGSPVIQPEQIRWMTYAALAAGYRGLAFHGDADLTREAGRQNLLEMALLNAEIDLCESILANGGGGIPSYAAFDMDPPLITPGLAIGQRPPKKPELKPLGLIRGASINAQQDRKTALLVVADYAGGAQFQPMQSARNDVTMTVIAPENAAAFQISPGRFDYLESKRDVGGIRITLKEFDTAALVLVTTDIALAQRVEAQINSIAPRAVGMAIEQAELKLQWVRETNDRLNADGHVLILDKERKRRRDSGGPLVTDEADLLRKAEESIKAARDFSELADWENAWSEARRASRSLRILMRGQWTNALEATEDANTLPEDLANENKIKLNKKKRVGPPLSVQGTGSAPLLSFNMLPQQYLWIDWMKSGKFGRNLIPTGSFDESESLKQAGWSFVGYQYEDIASVVEFEPEKEGSDRNVLKLTVIPKEVGGIDKLSPFLDFPAAALQSPPVPVRAGQFLRISVLAKRPVPTVEGIGGVILRDSIGGEALQFSTTDGFTKYTKLLLYRRVPEDGDLTVTIGLAGYGRVFFNDLRVERVESAPAFEPPGVAQAPRRSPRSTTALPARPGIMERRNR